jgi:hypothetical protein
MARLRGWPTFVSGGPSSLTLLLEKSSKNDFTRSISCPPQEIEVLSLTPERANSGGFFAHFYASTPRKSKFLNVIVFKGNKKSESRKILTY